PSPPPTDAETAPSPSPACGGGPGWGPAGAEILQLHGELPVDRQARVLQPASDGRRRVVLATNIAESSVTLPGVRVVIDSGLAREPRFDPGSGFPRLDVVHVSQASADQRAGRAGRVAEGHAYRLWPASRSEEHTSELQSREKLVCRLLLEKKKTHHLQIAGGTRPA